MTAAPISPHAITTRIHHLERQRGCLLAWYASAGRAHQIAHAEAINRWDCGRDGAELNALRVLLAALTR
jgi:hypothetical protein